VNNIILGISGGALLGVGILLFLYVRLMGKINKFMKDLDVVLNTGRGWEKRWKVCQEMFSKRMIGV
jgi:hypothetical protein